MRVEGGREDIIHVPFFNEERLALNAQIVARVAMRGHGSADYGIALRPWCFTNNWCVRLGLHLRWPNQNHFQIELWK